MFFKQLVKILIFQNKLMYYDNTFISVDFTYKYTYKIHSYLYVNLVEKQFVIKLLSKSRHLVQC